MSQILRLRLGAATHDSERDFPVPDGWQVTMCPPQDRAAISDEQVRQALRAPVGCEPIAVAARGAKRVALLVDDFRRPTPAERLCRLVLEQLAEAGVTSQQVTILLGNGAHRAMNRREVRARLGTLCDEVGQVVSHDAYSSAMTYVGLTSAGTPVLVNAQAIADFSVSLSCLYPHRLVAWGGGAKMVLPGIAHISTIHCHHGRLPAGQWGGPPSGCASRRDVEEAANLYGLSMSLCSVINSRKELCGLAVGEPTQAHRRAVTLARKVGDTPVPEPHPDLIIANAYPFDADGTQYSKAQAPALLFDCPMLVVNDFADPSIFHGLYHGPLREFRKQPPAPPVPHTAALLAQARVFFYSPQYAKGFFPPNRDWYCDHDWDRLMADLERRFPRAKVLVFPCAPLQLPRIVAP